MTTVGPFRSPHIWGGVINSPAVRAAQYALQRSDPSRGLLTGAGVDRDMAQAWQTVTPGAMATANARRFLDWLSTPDPGFVAPGYTDYVAGLYPLFIRRRGTNAALLELIRAAAEGGVTVTFTRGQPRSDDATAAVTPAWQPVDYPIAVRVGHTQGLWVSESWLNPLSYLPQSPVNDADWVLGEDTSGAPEWMTGQRYPADEVVILNRTPYFAGSVIPAGDVAVERAANVPGSSYNLGGQTGRRAWSLVAPDSPAWAVGEYDQLDEASIGGVDYLAQTRINDVRVLPWSPLNSGQWGSTAEPITLAEVGDTPFWEADTAPSGQTVYAMGTQLVVPLDLAPFVDSDGDIIDPDLGIRGRGDPTISIDWRLQTNNPAGLHITAPQFATRDIELVPGYTWTYAGTTAEYVFTMTAVRTQVLRVRYALSTTITCERDFITQAWYRMEQRFTGAARTSQAFAPGGPFLPKWFDPSVIFPNGLEENRSFGSDDADWHRDFGDRFWAGGFPPRIQRPYRTSSDIASVTHAVVTAADDIVAGENGVPTDALFAAERRRVYGTTAPDTDTSDVYSIAGWRRRLWTTKYPAWLPDDYLHLAKVVHGGLTYAAAYHLYPPIYDPESPLNNDLWGTDVPLWVPDRAYGPGSNVVVRADTYPQLDADRTYHRVGSFSESVPTLVAARQANFPGADVDLGGVAGLRAWRYLGRLLVFRFDPDSPLAALRMDLQVVQDDGTPVSDVYLAEMSRWARWNWPLMDLRVSRASA